ncbi:hypothetical protein [Micromonospora sediminicola]|uniref:hypothetical protein n=1 Tax=Micromonospora sediminicola TaxID=946078 RepID=UPI0037B0978A
MNRARPVQIVSGRHPFEIAVLLAVLICGVVLMVTDRRPASVAAAMPAGVQAAWQVGLVVAGVIGLAALAWPGSLPTSMGVELVSMVALGTSTSMYAVALYVVSGMNAIAAGAFIVAVAVASWARVGQIIRDLRRVARAAEQGLTADVPLLMERER